MTELKALVFDWGGVLQRTVNQTSRHTLDSELGLALGNVEAAVFESEWWHLASIGQCSAARAWAGIAAHLGFAPNQVGTLIQRFFANDTIDRQLVFLVEHLRRSGLKVGLLSNAPPGHGPVDVASARWGLEGLFETQVFSYQVGALKPDPRTYAAILRALRVDASETLFIDDSPVNIKGALDVGMRAHLFVDTRSLWATLEACGLTIPGRTRMSGELGP